MPLTRGAKVFLGLGALAVASNYYFKRRSIALEAASHDPLRQHESESYRTPSKGAPVPRHEQVRSAKQQAGVPTTEESMMDKLSTAGHIAKIHGQNIVEDVTQGAKEIASAVSGPSAPEPRQPRRMENAPLLDSDNNWHNSAAGVVNAVESVRDKLEQGRDKLSEQMGLRGEDDRSRRDRQRREADMEQLQWEREQLSGRDMLNNQVKRGGLMYQGDIRDVPKTKFDEMDTTSMQRKDRYDLRDDVDRTADRAQAKVDKIIKQDVKPRMEQAKEGVKSMVRGDSYDSQESRQGRREGGSDRYLDRLNEMMEDTRSRFEYIKSEASDPSRDPKRSAGQQQRSIGEAVSRGKEQGRAESQQMYGQLQDVSRDVEYPRTAHDQMRGPSPRRVESASDLFQQPRGRPSSPESMERVRGELEQSRGRGADSRDKGSRESDSGIVGNLMDKAADVGIISHETRDSMAQKAENVKDVIASHAYDASKDIQKRKAAIQAGEPTTDVLGSQARDASIDVAKGVGELKEAVSDRNVDTQKGTSSPTEPGTLHAAKPFVYKESHRETTPTKFVSPRETQTMK